MKKTSQHGGSMTVILVIVVLIVAGALVYNASGGFSTSPEELNGATASAELDRAAPDTTVESAPARSEQTSKPLPDGYPGDTAPMYESSTVTLATKMGSGVSLQYLVVAETDDDIDVVARSLADYYETQGVKVKQTPLNDKGVGQIVVSRDGYGVAITYGPADQPSGTSISYSVRPQRARN